MSHLYLLAGSNGAGKTTLYERVIGPTTGLPFVNADKIASALAGGEPITEALSLEAAQLAAQRRSDLIDQGRSFVAETVFSHPSKVDNSRLRTPFQVLARYTDGRGQVSPSASWPRWVPPELHPDNVCH